MREKNKTKSKVKNKNITKIRAIFLGLIFAFILFALTANIIYIQIVKGEEYRRLASMQQVTKSNKILNPIRGSIKDRNGNELVISKRMFNIVLDPQNLVKIKKENLEILKQYLAEKLEMSLSDVEKAITQENHYTILKKALSKELAEEMREYLTENEYSYIYFEEVFKREYLAGIFASHVIGFATTESGRWGVELKYDSHLKGETGREFITFDNDIPVNEIIPPKDGYSVVLTIDKIIQNFIEDSIRRLELEFKPQNISIIAMNPNTGEILGMASSPEFNPNTPQDILDEGYRERLLASGVGENDILNAIWKNTSITNSYEPGSTFKANVMAAALEENIITVNTRFTCTGKKVLYGQEIKCTASHGDQSIEDALKNSCNVALMEIGLLMGKQKFYDYQKAFGVGEFTEIDLPGEESARSLMYTANELGPVELATSSFGQSFNQTPIQMLTSFISVINGGRLLRPYTVSKVIDKNGSIIYQNASLEMRRVLSKDVSNIMKKYLETVISRGTGKRAYVEGYRIGGKTATAEKLPRGSGKYVTSFITFAPVDDPKIALIVLVDDPQTTDPYGGTVAGPIAREIMEKSLKYLGVPKSTRTTEKLNLDVEVSLSNYVDYNIVNAIADLQSKKLSYRVVGNGSFVERQEPASGTILPYNSQVLLYATSKSDTLVPMPNLINLKYEEALTKLKNLGLAVEENEKNNGKIVEKQIPLSGVKIDSGTKVLLEYK